MQPETRYPIHNSRRKGVALIIVLAILILVTALVVGFLVRTGSERAAAASYRATARTRQLADTVVNLVQAQINQGTTTVASGSTYAWASQPGAIRIFDNQGNQTIYKLYSSGTMVTGSYGNIAGDMPPHQSGSATWMGEPSLWVDLNAPAAFTISGAPSLAYPILDPRDPGGGDFTTGTLAGFQVNPAQIGLTENPLSPIAPMPAQWLYVLQDGTIVPPGLGSTGTSVIITATNVSASNPIVGRVAFWTDDDTCRLNINTAGDGTFWDTPHFTAPDDWCFAFLSPASYEYQRYPGHPATTSLLPLLSTINPTAFPANSNYSALTSSTMQLPYLASGANFPFFTPNNPYTTAAYQNLFSLTPQYAYGGSEEGSFIGSTVDTGIYGEIATTLSSGTCPLNNQRLYSSVGELLYSSSNNGASPPGRYYNSALVTGGTAQALNRQQLETAKFFLTAHSRAPELNLFGLPRVSIWPFSVGSQFNGPTAITLSSAQVVPPANPFSTASLPAYNTPTDQLLAFAATINGTANSNGPDPYYFMRGSNIDLTDINITRNGVPQNQLVLEYLDNLMSRPVPGFSENNNSTFYGKYGPMGVRQLLTEIFDYVRTTDTEDGDVLAENGLANTATPGSMTHVFGQDGVNSFGPGHVVPSVISGSNMAAWAATSGTYEGFGTFPRPDCVAIHFVAVGSGTLSDINGNPVGTALNIPAAEMAYSGYSHYDPAIQLSGTTTTPPNQGIVPNGKIAIQAYVYVQCVIPASARLLSNSPLFWISMTGLNTLTLNGSNLGFSGSGNMQYSWNLGGGLGAYGNDQFTGLIPIFGETLNHASGYPFCSQIITLPYTYGGSSSLSLGGGSNVVMQLRDNASSSDLIQTVALNFNTPATSETFPFPVNPLATPGTVLSGTVLMRTNGHPGDPPAAGAILSGTVPTGGNGNGSSTFLSNARVIGTGATTGTSSPILDMNLNDRWAAGPGQSIDEYHDVIESLVLSASSGWGDPRMLAIANVPATAFVAHPFWGQRFADDLRCTSSWVPFDYLRVGGTSGYTAGSLVGLATGKLQGAAGYPSNALPAMGASGSNGASFYGGTTAGGLTFGDWDNGISYISDGPWINRADEGGASTGALYGNSNGSVDYYLPYYTGGNGTMTMGPGVFSPSREVPSPVTFGSLPTGVDPTGVNPKPWQTLLFRPGTVINHPGAGQSSYTLGESQLPAPPFTTIPDHLILDLFWMPVAEPYAISEPFSTAGKVNLNYQILPYGYVSAATGTTPYIRRDTGIRSAMSGLRIAGVSLSATNTYKSLGGPAGWWNNWPGTGFPGDPPGSANNTARMAIDVDQTFQQFDSIFENGQLFESASQICDLYLVPAGYTCLNFSGAAGAAGSWYGNDFAMVGDNVRERPYADLYSRVTTKSNTFTVYFTVQELKSAPNTPPNQWNEATGTVVGEYRGSKDMERYIQQDAIPDLLANPAVSGSTSLEPYYRWRILEDNRFAP